MLEEFGKNVTAKAKTPEEWKARRTPMFSHAYSEYISSLESGGNYQGGPASFTPAHITSPSCLYLQLSGVL